MDNTYYVERFRFGQIDLPLDSENFAFMYYQEYGDVFGETMSSKTKPNEIAGYLKISTRNGKSVYRKFRGWNGVKRDIVQLTYRTMCEIGVKPGDEVTIEPSNWFTYYWRNSNAGIKYPFIIAFLGILFAFASFLLSIIPYFCSCNH